MTPTEIRDIRQRLGLTQQQFAEALGYEGPNANRLVRRWELGERTPNKRLQNLIRALGDKQQP